MTLWQKKWFKIKIEWMAQRATYPRRCPGLSAVGLSVLSAAQFEYFHVTKEVTEIRMGELQTPRCAGVEGGAPTCGEVTDPTPQGERRVGELRSGMKQGWGL